MTTYGNEGHHSTNAGEETSVDTEDNQLIDHRVRPPESSAGLLKECAEEYSNEDVPSSCQRVHRHRQWLERGKFHERRHMDAKKVVCISQTTGRNPTTHAFATYT